MASVPLFVSVLLSLTLGLSFEQSTTSSNPDSDRVSGLHVEQMIATLQESVDNLRRVLSEKADVVVHGMRQLTHSMAAVNRDVTCGNDGVLKQINQTVGNLETTCGNGEELIICA